MKDEKLAPPDGYTVRSIPAIPALGPLYAKGAASSGRIALKRLQSAREIPGIPGLYADPVSPAEGNAFVAPPVVYRVARVKTKHLKKDLHAYQRLVGEPVSDTFPSGFLHVLAFPLATAVMVRPDFPLPLLGMVHLANDASLFQPVHLGDVLEVRAWAENLRAHAKGVQVDIVAEVWVEKRTDGSEPSDDDKPALAWRGRSNYLARGVSLEPTGSDSAAIIRRAGVEEQFAAEDAARAAEDSEPDSAPAAWTPPFPTGRWELPADTGRAYAAISGDRNPIHMSSLSARAFGFPRAIAHGMYTAARALAEVGPTRGDTYRWTVEFAKPVLLPGKVEVAITPDADGDGFTYQGWNAKKGKPHFTGTVTRI